METAVKTYSNWNGIMRLRCQLLVLCCICCNPMALSAQERLQELFACRKASLPNTDFGTVTLRLYPLASSAKALTSSETSLSNAVADQDVLSIGLALSIKPQATTKLVIPLIARQWTPDTVMVVRGSEVTVFPRMFLALPQVGMSAVKNGDYIATLYRQAQEKTPEKSDPLRRIIPTAAAVGKKSPASVRYTGILLPKSVAGVKKYKATDTKQLSTILEDVADNGNGIEEAIQKESENRLKLRCPVCVVKRRVDGYLVSYVCPLRLTGLFAKQGAMTRVLCGSEDINVAERFWEDFFLTKHQDIDLLDGDTVEFTLVDTLSPFHRLASMQ